MKKTIVESMLGILAVLMLTACGVNTNTETDVKVLEETEIVEATPEATSEVQSTPKENNSEAVEKPVVTAPVEEEEVDDEIKECPSEDTIKQIMQEQVDFYLDDIIETLSINGYNEDDIAQIQSFENNMVLDYKGDTYWMRPPYPEDEEGMAFDEPLGVYSKKDFIGSLDEDEDYLFEYGLGGHVIKAKEYSNYNVATIQYKLEGNEICALRYYYMLLGIENVMTYEVFWDYDVLDSYDSFDTSKMEDMNDSEPYFWQEDNGDLNLIFNYERKKVSHHGYSEMKYNFSALCRCRYENEKYIVDEVIPLKMQ